MMVYCCDRSLSLPRKPRRKKLKARTSVITPYRATQHDDKPSMIDKHVVDGQWLNREEVLLQEALEWLNAH